jgi:hypothetical protein
MPAQFLFEPGVWLGAGQVTFSISPDLLYYRTKWSIVEGQLGRLQCTQTVEIVGGDQMINVFSVIRKDQNSFDITLENELLGIFSGQGVLEKELIAWEFREPGKLEGYEVYERTSEEEYSMRAEYISSSDGARTKIQGKIWKAKIDLGSSDIDFTKET